MTFSLAQAQLYRLLNGGHQVQILNQTDLGQDRHLIVVAGQWFGQDQIKCYLIQRHAGQWLTIQLPNDWIAETARLLQPLLPDPEKKE